MISIAKRWQRLAVGVNPMSSTFALFGLVLLAAGREPSGTSLRFRRASVIAELQYRLHVVNQRDVIHQ